jgi:hypothetical protein
VSRSQINIKVKSETKEEWDTFVEEEQEVGSLTELIRRSVENFISAHHAESSEEGLQEDVFLSEIESLRSDIDSLQDAVKATQYDQLTVAQVREASVEANEELWDWYFPQLLQQLDADPKEVAADVDEYEGPPENIPESHTNADDEDEGEN